MGLLNGRPPRSRHLLALSLALALLAALLGCGGNSGGNPGSTQSGDLSSGSVPRLRGELVVTGETTLDLLAAGRRTVIARAPAVSAYFEYPTFSPDGKMVAYVLATTPTGQGQDWGNDIYSANVDGSNARMVLKHDRPGALIDSLSWTPDGSSLIYAYQRALYDAQNHYTGSIYRVDKLMLSSGASATLIENAMQPSVSWDGKQIVYVDFPQNDFQAASLAIANIDGSQAHKLLADQRGFQGFFAPHLSPDGKKLVFAAVGGPLGGPGSPTPAAHREQPLSDALSRLDAALTASLRPPPALADGSPYQVWIVNVDGTDLRAISNLREDLPFPLWAADGQSILFLGAAGLYTANADATNLKRIAAGIPHGEIAWFQGS